MCFIHDMYTCFHNMERVSKRLMFLGTVLYLAAVAAAVICFFYFAKTSDYSTALFWYNEFMELSKETLGAVFVPVMIFELICIGSGAKITLK